MMLVFRPRKNWLHFTVKILRKTALSFVFPDESSETDALSESRARDVGRDWTYKFNYTALIDNSVWM